MESKNTPDEIEATLKSFDGMSRAEASPFFYAKLEAKLQQRKTSAFDGFLQILTRPAVAVSMLTVFLVFNIIAIKGISASNSNASAPKSASLQSFATEYNLNTSSLYTNSDK